jgi:hypothetical protein
VAAEEEVEEVEPEEIQFRRACHLQIKAAVVVAQMVLYLITSELAVLLVL